VILHRLRLTNFRGVADREITFPDQGVVVVCGPNEIGKSSMLEALDLLLAFRDRSTHRDVKAVKPTSEPRSKPRSAPGPTDSSTASAFTRRP
jgi:predicted ATP-dependent endonuclease of OLD family